MASDQDILYICDVLLRLPAEMILMNLFRAFLIVLFSCSLLFSAGKAEAQEYSNPWFIPAGSESGLPRVVANENRTPAGVLTDGVLEIDLELVWSDWRLETADGPGIRVMAIAERGKILTIPGPLIRVEEGTRVKARVRNSVPDSTVTVFGFHERPNEHDQGIALLPGESHEFYFEAGKPGTYFYYLQKGQGLHRRTAEYEQLTGAFIIDPVGGSPPDRIFVMNIFTSFRDRAFPVVPRRVVALTINGHTFPFTERLEPTVGEKERWRVINASRRSHPMHLHGFFYNVLSVGGISSDITYSQEQRREVVTELMPRQSTMMMEWIPAREGNWLFHCHFSFHVGSGQRLPTADIGEHEHMAGLVLGISVKPGKSDLISRGEPRYLTLHANQHGADSLEAFSFSFDSGFQPDETHLRAPGPVMFLQRYQDTYVTVQNHMSTPTGVHWHGLELDSWSDGVPFWSASDGKVSPVIEPGEEFAYKLSLMRSGTFIYHSHLNDVRQLSGGLYGPIIVLDEGEEFDPEFDHIYTIGYNRRRGRPIEDWEMNGRQEQPDMIASVGEDHRLRLINITPAGVAKFWMTKDGQPVKLRAIAKDGADLPESQRVEVEIGQVIGSGETIDYMFSPSEPGVYQLGMGPNPSAAWTQKWIVSK